MKQSGLSSWPAKSEVSDCDPRAVAALAINAGCNDAPYAIVDQSEGEEPKTDDVAFWDRVQEESNRIAGWAVQGLGITGRATARLGAQVEAADVRRTADMVERALAKRGITVSEEALAIIAETAVQSIDNGDSKEWQIEECLGPKGRESWLNPGTVDTDYQSAITRYEAQKSRERPRKLRLVLKRVTIVDTFDSSGEHAD